MIKKIPFTISNCPKLDDTEIEKLKNAGYTVRIF